MVGRRGRLLVTPDLLFELLKIPPGGRLVGPCDPHGCLEITIEHPSLPEIETPEGGSPPLVRREDLS